MTIVRVAALYVTFALRWVVDPATVMKAFALVTVSLRTASLVVALMLAVRLAPFARFFGVVFDTAGPMLSTMTTTPGDAAETLPNESVDDAVSVWDPFVKPLTGAAHCPIADAVVVAFTAPPSRTFTVDPDGALPETVKTPSRSRLPLAGAAMAGAAGASTVEICSDQPVRDPRSPELSSTTYRLQVPFGSVPLKVDRADPPVATGAGAGNASTPAPGLVGWKVPPTTGEGTGPAAASSRTSVALLTSVPEPVSLRIVACWPAGPTSRTSTSPGNVCVSPDRVTLTSVMPLGCPETAIVEG